MSDRPALPPEFAFVVQFADSDPPGPLRAGRVEHVVSGHCARFADSAELIAFIEATVAQLDRGRPR